MRKRQHIALCALLAACGGGNGGMESEPAGPLLTRTTAYVMTECQAGAATHQELFAIKGDGEPALIAPRLSVPGLPGPLCDGFGTSRAGASSVVAGFYHRLGVRPDGGVIAFEVTDDFATADSIFDARGTLRPEQEGIFVVNADGSGLRRVGPASRAPDFRFKVDLSDFAVSQFPGFAFSPDGTIAAYIDIGPGPDGEDVMQLFTLRVADGVRQQITCLPALTPVPFTPAIVGPLFVDNETVAFAIPRSPSDMSINFVKIDGRCELITRPPPVAVPGASVVPSFSITGSDRFAYGLFLPEVPAVNPVAGVPVVIDIFVEAADSLLQLTDFRRVDTGNAYLVGGGMRVAFAASVDLGENPRHVCQFFSVDVLGRAVEQLTHFDAPADVPAACLDFAPPSCGIQSFGQDLTSDVLLFYSSCDPFGTNPNGGQLFAMRSDGTGLRQLTNARGAVAQPDGTLRVQLPGPFVYSPAFP